MSAQTEKPLRTVKAKSSAMFCGSCSVMTIAKWTATRIYKNGRQVERQLCSECNCIQETEFIVGPTTRIRNKK